MNHLSHTIIHYVLIGNHLDGPTRAIDIMPDSILRDWLIKRIFS